MKKQLLFVVVVMLLLGVSESIYFQNQGCIEKTLDGYECNICQSGFYLQDGLCKVTGFNHTVKSDHPYYRVYVGQEIVVAASSDPILNRVLSAVKQHSEYEPSITMVRERSQVAIRTNYRVMCENSGKKVDFFVYYFYKTDAVTIVGVNTTVLESTTYSRLLSVMGNGHLSGVVSVMKDKKVAAPGNSAAASVVKKGNSQKKNKQPVIAASNPSIVKGKKSVKINLDFCEKILKRRNMLQVQLLTHRWSPYKKSWQQKINSLNIKYSQCVVSPPVPSPTPTPVPSTTPLPAPQPTPTPIPVVDPVIEPTTPAINTSEVSTPSNVTDYTTINQHQGSVTVGEAEIYKTENNLSPDYFSDDVRIVVQLFSLQQQIDLSNNVIFIEFLSDGVVDEYAITAKFRANDTVRFYSLRIVASNQFLFMGKEFFPYNFSPSQQQNKFLIAMVPTFYTDADSNLFSQLSQFITANNGSHFDMKILQISKRAYPNGTYYVTDIHIDNDVNAESHVVKLNGAGFMNVKYQETSIKTATTPAIVVDNSTSNTTTNPLPAVPLYDSSSCCSTLQQKQDACVSYLKQYYSTVPNLAQASIVYTQNQALPSGISFDFYLEYADDLVVIGYTATVARYNDGSYTILMFDFA